MRGEAVVTTSAIQETRNEVMVPKMA